MIMDELLDSFVKHGTREDLAYFKEFKVFDLNPVYQDVLSILLPGKTDLLEATPGDVWRRTKYRLPYPKIAGFYSIEGSTKMIFAEEITSPVNFGVLGSVFDTTWIAMNVVQNIKSENHLGFLTAVLGFPVSEEGKMLNKPGVFKLAHRRRLQPDAGVFYEPTRPGDTTSQHLKAEQLILSGMLLLLHSKYRILNDVHFSSKHARKRQQKGRAPLKSYKVLKVPAFLRPQRGETFEHWHVRLHDVRGHFKQVKIRDGHREVFVQPYQKGDPLLGQVVKDYKVEQPK